MNWKLVVKIFSYSSTITLYIIMLLIYLNAMMTKNYSVTIHTNLYGENNIEFIWVFVSFLVTLCLAVADLFLEVESLIIKQKED